MAKTIRWQKLVIELRPKNTDRKMARRAQANCIQMNWGWTVLSLVGSVKKFIPWGIRPGVGRHHPQFIASAPAILVKGFLFLICRLLGEALPFP